MKARPPLAERCLCAVLLALMLAACAAPRSPDPPGSPAAAKAQQVDDTTMDSQLLLAAQLLKDKRAALALPIADAIVAHYEGAYRSSGGRAYSARTPAERLAYLTQASTAGSPATVYPETWGEAYYLRGYALVELGRLPEAMAALGSAVELAPRNSRYLSERAQVYALQKEWRTSLKEFRTAYEAADVSPEDAREREQTRALRGMAYAEIELKNLDTAELLHRRVLQIDPTDPVSIRELLYIRLLRQKQNAPVPEPKGVI